MKQLTVLLVLAGCSIGIAQDKQLRSGILLENFDKSIRPQDNLFNHVNGRWLMRTEIPEDKSNYGSFTALSDEAVANVKALMIEASKTSGATGNAQKIGDFYKSFMDTSAIEQAGIDPLMPEMEKIDSLKTTEDVIRHFGYLQQVGIGGPIAFFVGADAKNSKANLAAVFQSGTSLPDRDYYFVDNPNCLLYTSPSPRDQRGSRMPSSA